MFICFSVYWNVRLTAVCHSCGKFSIVFFLVLTYFLLSIMTNWLSMTVRIPIHILKKNHICHIWCIDGCLCGLNTINTMQQVRNQINSFIEQVWYICLFVCQFYNEEVFKKLLIVAFFAWIGMVLSLIFWYFCITCLAVKQFT